MLDFPQLTSRTRFAAEVSITPYLLSVRKVWPLDIASTQPLRTRSVCVQEVEAGADSIIPKPRGQVSEISKGGYSLIDALGWEEARYKSVQVRILYAYP